MVLEETDKSGNLSPPKFDPIVLEALENIRQEVEDLAYERLRSVLSDFSLQDPELNERVECHKLYIQEKAHEIVKRRLQEMKLLISEAEFWCICGKHYDKTHERRTPLIERVMKPMEPVASYATAQDLLSSSDKSSVSPIDLDKSHPGVHDMDKISKSKEISYPGEGWSTDEAEFNLIDNTITYHKSKIADEAPIESFDIEQKDNEQFRPHFESGTSKRPKKELSTRKKYDEFRKNLKRPEITDQQRDELSDESAELVREKQTNITSTALNTFKLAEEVTTKQSIENELSENVEKIYSVGEEYVEENFQSDQSDQPSSRGADAESSFEEYGYSSDEILEELDNAGVAEIVNNLIDNQLTKAINDIHEDKETSRAEKLSDLSKLFGSSDTHSLSLATSESILDQFTTKDLQYLHEAFGNCLEIALAEVTMKKPSSPLSYLAQYLMFYGSDKLFDRFKREDYTKRYIETQQIAESKSKVYNQKLKLMEHGEEIRAMLFKAGFSEGYTFDHVGKITMRRGRRLRKPIITICDKLLEKSPLHMLSRKIRKLKTFKNILRYIYALLRDLKMEIHYLKQETIIKVYSMLVHFLSPILPELSSRRTSFCELTSERHSIKSMDSELNDVDEESPGYYELLEKLSYSKDSSKSDSDHDIEKKYFQYNGKPGTKCRGSPNPYPCINTNRKQEYKCRTPVDKNEDRQKYESERNKILHLLHASGKRLKIINHIDKDTACLMCANTLGIIENIRRMDNEMKARLINFISKEYINVGINSMFEQNYDLVKNIKSNDSEIVPDVLSLLDHLLEFQSLVDINRIRSKLTFYIEDILQKQEVKLEKFKDEQKYSSIRELEKRMRLLMEITQLDPCDAPCSCAEDSKKETGSENSWSDDEDGLTDYVEQERLNKAVYRVSQTVEDIMICDQNVIDIQQILEAFVTRASRDRPYLSKRANSDYNRMRKLVAGLFVSMRDDSYKNPDFGKADYVCMSKPCVCKFVLQASWTMLAVHSRMLRQFDAYRVQERNEIELEIMKMFSAFVKDLTVEKIQKQNLCTGVMRF